MTDRATETVQQIIGSCSCSAEYTERGIPDPACEWCSYGEELVAAMKAIQGPPDHKSFQTNVATWMHACFSLEITNDLTERNHRFVEEGIELAQACGATASECHQLVDYVYGRPVGEPDQEVGGVMVTLAALCNTHGMDMQEAGERELARIWGKIEQIRAKQAAKPKHSPLPENPND